MQGGAKAKGHRVQAPRSTGEGGTITMGGWGWGGLGNPGPDMRVAENTGHHKKNIEPIEGFYCA
jgi:hypothetical protein